VEEEGFNMSRSSSGAKWRTVLSAVAALGITLASSAQAANITFNPTGNGIASDNIAIAGLNFAPGNALAVGAINPATGTLTTSPFTVTVQTHLDSVTLTNGQTFVPAGLNTAYQITEVATLQEQVDTAHSTPATANFTLVPTPGNKFNIYFNPAVTYNNSAGTGFTDGTTILTKTPTSFNGANFTDTTKSSGASLVPFNQTSSAYPPSPTATADRGSGSFSVNLLVNSFLPNFFQPPSGQPFLTTSINASNQQSFFDVAPPSVSFTNLITGTTLTPAIGSNNGTSGPDFQFQVSGVTESFNVIPEPASISMALTALGIVPLAVWQVRRRAKA
jgi:hypothetical protein